MYTKLGYSVYRRILKCARLPPFAVQAFIAVAPLTQPLVRYYSDNDEDGLDMRKALPRDVHKVLRLCLRLVPASVRASACECVPKCRLYLMRRCVAQHDGVCC